MEKDAPRTAAQNGLRFLTFHISPGLRGGWRDIDIERILFASEAPSPVPRVFTKSFLMDFRVPAVSQESELKVVFLFLHFGVLRRADRVRRAWMREAKY
ncbi:hypothetical protein Prudu_001398 [Prunus dulcis]|uniref:Uncharacterized protein n=1 Tax=Prunus dulcis TaxID=3755 RepID=A0A4Y1QNI2_PRUDU|nr:hypothetical protein Prudu_001398 [Prunus dulcis]